MDGSSQAFQHIPLNNTEDEIRLFQLEFDEKQPLVSCKLKTFELKTCPPFVAVSYTWGPPEPRKIIFVNKCEFEVRENLWNFLLTLCLDQTDAMATSDSVLFGNDRENAYFWCDQLCIDQSNTQERNHQVSLMSRIYSTAAETLVWLGTDDERAPGRDALRPNLALESPTDLSWPDSNYTARSRLGKQTPSEDKILSTMMQSPYWNRLWIAQEIWFSKKIFLLHGEHILPWSSLQDDVSPSYMRSATSEVEFENRIRSIPSRVRDLVVEKRHFADGDQRLSYILESFGGLECADIRDKVFGLQGLVSEKTRVAVDYSLTLEALFYKVFAKVVGDETHLSHDSQTEFAEDLFQKLRLDPDMLEDFPWSLERRMSLERRSETKPDWRIHR